MLEFFYDVASPFTYLAAMRIDDLAESAGVEVRWRPFLLGGVFKSTGNAPPASVPAKGRYLFQDLRRHSKRHGLKFWFSSTFPHNSLLAQRALTAAGDRQVELAKALFKATWEDDRNLADPAVVTDIVGAELVALAQEQATKDALKATTEEAVKRGAFGAPTYLIGEELFWGHDRIEWAIEAAAAG